ncbi:hypothetical protein D3C80_2156770 [compost metagenome]
MVKSLAPSIFADSITSSGTAERIKFFINIMRNGVIRPGKINTVYVSVSFKYFVSKMYQGTSPPPNSVVK